MARVTRRDRRETTMERGGAGCSGRTGKFGRSVALRLSRSDGCCALLTDCIVLYCIALYHVVLIQINVSKARYEKEKEKRNFRSKSKEEVIMCNISRH